MEIIQKEENGIVCVTVKGRIEARLSPELERTIAAILKSGQTRLLFDLSALEYLRSSVLRVILSAIKTLNRRNGRVVLCRLNDYVSEIFEVNRFRDSITIADSLESGLQAFACELKAA
ncbi:MAG: STAS domain-containing protein [Deltaproteobacteria bacterium]|jgi:anti-anti-sigma factor|nr:STAS domain-containing protein [Deltaproteobacteria bacterium]MBW2468055.1 STAS domain-containing protein [Deltaproteobacteria bacterium]